MKKHKLIAFASAAAILAGSIAGVTQFQAPGSEVTVHAAEKTSTKAPKYIFLFIGDGMSYPQVQITNSYLSAMADKNEDGILQADNYLSYTNFGVAGSAQTYDSTSFCPDSASTATSISTGHKTYSGVINMSEDKKVPYTTIAEKLKAQKGYKVGVITSVNLNHATPAAFYAHQASRKNYYEIGQEMVASNFDYFAGGGLLKPTGNNNDLTSLYDIAEQSGYHVVTTQAEAMTLSPSDGKSILIDEHLADEQAMAYQMDAQPGEWVLSDYVDKGIEMLDNKNGFFMMVEGGKIDWACHANDAAATINDTLALDDAVKEAIEFYNEHPSETLILVTGDHETGGLTIGYSGTNYDTFLTNISNQKISYAKFDTDYVTKYKAERTSFNNVMNDVYDLFGLTTDASKAASPSLVLTEYEVGKLKDAYARSMKYTAEEQSAMKQTSMTQREYELYGTYEPLTVTITHILNNKSGISFSSYSHTGVPVGVFAKGVNEKAFEGYYDNTDIYKKLAAMTGVK